MTSSRLRSALPVLALAALLACRHDNPVAAPNSVSGVWTGQLPTGSPRDSVLLVIIDSTPRVPVLGYFAPMRSEGLQGIGTRSGEAIDLSVTELSPPGLGGPLLSFHFQLTLRGNELRGQVHGTPRDRQAPVAGEVTLHRSPAPPNTLVGRWALTTVRASPSGPVPLSSAPLDTIALAPEGRVTWSRDWRVCGFTQVGVARTAGASVVLEYIPYAGGRNPVGCLFAAFDTLRIVGDTLVRRTPLADGRVEEWLYQRP